MSASYLAESIVSMKIYSHANGIQITTGLWAENNFLPQVYVHNEDEWFFFSISDWNCVFKEFKMLGFYNVNNLDNSSLLIFRFIYLEKRCSVQFVNLVLEAINSFGLCINLRLVELSKEYIIAKRFVKNIESSIRITNLSSLQNTFNLLNNFANLNSITELEIANIDSAYFLNFFMD